jgi:Zn finger protein HypA/HybF involved in hydrogenase expression
MNTIVCEECGDEVDEGGALNGYCEKCLDKFIAQSGDERMKIPGIELPPVDKFKKQETAKKDR